MPKSQKEMNTNLLIALHQNIQTAMQSINNVMEKVQDSKLKRELKKQFKNYDEFSESCEDLAQAMDIELVNNGFFKKARMWFSVNMATMLDKSNRKIASINIYGTTMGVIDLMSVLSDCQKCKPELVFFGKRLLELEESNIERLKPYILVENNKPGSEIAEHGKSSGALENDHDKDEQSSPTHKLSKTSPHNKSYNEKKPVKSK